MRTTRRHVAQSIEGCLRNNPIGTIDFLEKDGKVLSDKEARAELQSLLDQGHKLLPTVSAEECPDFDVFGGGCPGHREDC